MREGEQQREDAAAVVYGFPVARHAAPAPSFALAERVAASGIFVDVRNLIQRAAGDEGRVTAPAAFQRAWEEMRCSYLHELKVRPARQGPAVRDDGLNRHVLCCAMRAPGLAEDAFGARAEGRFPGGRTFLTSALARLGRVRAS